MATSAAGPVAGGSESASRLSEPHWTTRARQAVLGFLLLQADPVDTVALLQPKSGRSCCARGGVCGESPATSREAVWRYARRYLGHWDRHTATRAKGAPPDSAPAAEWPGHKALVRRVSPTSVHCGARLRFLASKVLEHALVRAVISLAIAVSIVSLFFTQPVGADPEWISIVERVALVIFAAEAILKVLSRGLVSRAVSIGSGPRLVREALDPGVLIHVVLSVRMLRDEMRRQLRVAAEPVRPAEAHGAAPAKPAAAAAGALAMDPDGLPAERDLPEGPTRMQVKRRWKAVAIERRIRRRDRVAEPGYLQNAWDVADLLVLVVMFVDVFSEGVTANVTVLRVLRVFRVVRTVEVLPGLQIILVSLFRSCSFLFNVLVVMVFFYFIFAIIGVESLGLSLQRRCVDTSAAPLPGGGFPEAQLPDPEPAPYCVPEGVPASEAAGLICSTINPAWRCADTGAFPLQGLQSFQNVFYALFVVVQAASLEGWSDLAYAVLGAEGPLASIYFVLVVFVCNFLVLSLVTSVLIQQFGNTWEAFIARQREEKAAQAEAAAAAKEQAAIEAAQTLAANVAKLQASQANSGIRGAGGLLLASKMKLWARRAKTAVSKAKQEAEQAASAAAAATAAALAAKAKLQAARERVRGVGGMQLRHRMGGRVGASSTPRSAAFQALQDLTEFPDEDEMDMGMDELDGHESDRSSPSSSVEGDFGVERGRSGLSSSAGAMGAAEEETDAVGPLPETGTAWEPPTLVLGGGSHSRRGSAGSSSLDGRVRSQTSQEQRPGHRSRASMSQRLTAERERLHALRLVVAHTPRSGPASAVADAAVPGFGSVASRRSSSASSAAPGRPMGSAASDSGSRAPFWGTEPADVAVEPETAARDQGAGAPGMSSSRMQSTVSAQGVPEAHAGDQSPQRPQGEMRFLFDTLGRALDGPPTPASGAVAPADTIASETVSARARQGGAKHAAAGGSEALPPAEDEPGAAVLAAPASGPIQASDVALGTAAATAPAAAPGSEPSAATGDDSKASTREHQSGAAASRGRLPPPSPLSASKEATARGEAAGAERPESPVPPMPSKRANHEPGCCKRMSQRVGLWCWRERPPEPVSPLHRWAQAAVLGRPYCALQPDTPEGDEAAAGWCSRVTMTNWSSQWFASLVTSLSATTLVILGLEDPLVGQNEIRPVDAAAIAMTCLIGLELAFRAYALRGATLRSAPITFVDVVAFSCGVVATVFFVATADGVGSLTEGFGSVRARVFMSLTALRSVRLVEGLAPIRNLVLTAFRRGGAIANLILLLGLVTCVAGLFATQLFGSSFTELPPGEELPEPRLMFYSAPQSILVLFIVITGENWPSVLGNVEASGTSWAKVLSALIVLWYLATNVVLLQIFIAVVVEGIAEDDDVKVRRQLKSLSRCMVFHNADLEEAARKQHSSRLFVAEMILTVRAWQQSHPPTDPAAAAAATATATASAAASAGLGASSVSHHAGNDRAHQQASAAGDADQTANTAFSGERILRRPPPVLLVEALAASLSAGSLDLLTANFDEAVAQLAAERSKTLTLANAAQTVLARLRAAKSVAAMTPRGAGDTATFSKDGVSRLSSSRLGVRLQAVGGESDEDLASLRQRKHAIADRAPTESAASTLDLLHQLLSDALVLLQEREGRFDSVRFLIAMGEAAATKESANIAAAVAGGSDVSPGGFGSSPHVGEGAVEPPAPSCCERICCGSRAKRGSPADDDEAPPDRGGCFSRCVRPANKDDLDVDVGDDSVPSAPSSSFALSGSLGGLPSAISGRSSYASSVASADSSDDLPLPFSKTCKRCGVALRSDWRCLRPSCKATCGCCVASTVSCLGRLLDLCETARVRRARERQVSRMAMAGTSDPDVHQPAAGQNPVADGRERPKAVFGMAISSSEDDTDSEDADALDALMQQRVQAAAVPRARRSCLSWLSSVCGIAALERFQRWAYVARVKALPVDSRDRSLGCLPARHPVRGVAHACMCTRADKPGRSGAGFRNIMLLTILLSSLQLATEGRSFRRSSGAEGTLRTLDIVFAAIFATEAVLKITAFGLVAANEHSYLRRGWNVLDLVVAVFAVIDAFVDSRAYPENPITGLPPPWVSIIRLARCLRPLKFLEAVPATSRLVRAFSRSLGQIIAAVVLSLILLLSFGVLGRQFFAGAMGQCNDATVHLRANCQGLFVDDSGDTALRVWTIPTSSFESLSAGVTTLLETATLEGWIPTLTRCMDISGRDTGPVANASIQYALFFIVFIILAAFVILPVFTGIVANAVSLEREDASLTDQQKTLRGVLQQYAPPGDRSVLRKAMMYATFETQAARRIEARWRARTAASVSAGTLRASDTLAAVDAWHSVIAARPIGSAAQPAAAPMTPVPPPVGDVPRTVSSASAANTSADAKQQPPIDRSESGSAASAPLAAEARAADDLAQAAAASRRPSGAASDEGDPSEQGLAAAPAAKVKSEQPDDSGIAKSQELDVDGKAGPAVRQAAMATPAMRRLQRPSLVVATSAEVSSTHISPEAFAQGTPVGRVPFAPIQASLPGDETPPTAAGEAGDQASLEPRHRSFSSSGIGSAITASDSEAEGEESERDADAKTEHEPGAKASDGATAEDESHPQTEGDGEDAASPEADTESPQEQPADGENAAGSDRSGSGPSEHSDQGSHLPIGRAVEMDAVQVLARAHQSGAPTPGPKDHGPSLLPVESAPGAGVHSHVSHGRKRVRMHPRAAARPSRGGQLGSVSSSVRLSFMSALVAKLPPYLRRSGAKTVVRAATCAPTDTELALARATQARRRHRAAQSDRAYRRVHWGFLPWVGACSSCCCFATYRRPKRHGPPAFVEATDVVGSDSENDGNITRRDDTGGNDGDGGERVVASTSRSGAGIGQSEKWRIGTMSRSEDADESGNVAIFGRSARRFQTTLSHAGWTRLPRTTRHLFIQAARLEARAEAAAARAVFAEGTPAVLAAPRSGGAPKRSESAQAAVAAGHRAPRADSEDSPQVAGGPPSATSEAVRDAMPIAAAGASPVHAASVGHASMMLHSGSSPLGQPAHPLHTAHSTMGAHAVGTGTAALPAGRGPSRRPKSRHGRRAGLFVQTPLQRAHLGAIIEPLRSDECARVHCPSKVLCCFPVPCFASRTIAVTTCRCARDCCPDSSAACVARSRGCCLCLCRARLCGTSAWDTAHQSAGKLVNENRWFDWVATALVVLNALAMAFAHSPMEATAAAAMDITNTVFLAIFTVELLVRLAAHGCGRPLYKDWWLVFDFVIVTASIALRSVNTEAGVQAARALRIARLFRVMHLSRRLRVLVDTLASSVTALGSVTFTLVLVLFVYAVMGMQLFGAIGEERSLPSTWPNQPQSAVEAFNLTVNSTAGQLATASAWALDPLNQQYEGIHRYAHFRDFFTSLLLLFRMATGEDWQLIYHDAENRTGMWANIFFVSFVILVQAVVLDFYLAGVLEAFERAYHEQNDLMSYRDVALLRTAFDRYDEHAGTDKAGFVPLWAIDRLLARFAGLPFRLTVGWEIQARETEAVRMRLRTMAGYGRKYWDPAFANEMHGGKLAAQTAGAHEDRQIVDAIQRPEEATTEQKSARKLWIAAAEVAKSQAKGKGKGGGKGGGQPSGGQAATSGTAEPPKPSPWWVCCRCAWCPACCERLPCCKRPAVDEHEPTLSFFASALAATRLSALASSGDAADREGSGTVKGSAMRLWVARLLRDPERWDALRCQLRTRALLTEACLLSEQRRQLAQGVTGSKRSTAASAIAAASRVTRSLNISKALASDAVTDDVLSGPFGSSSRWLRDLRTNAATAALAAESFASGLNDTMGMPGASMRVPFSALVLVIAKLRVGTEFLTPHERFIEAVRNRSRDRIEQERHLAVFARTMRSRLSELRKAKAQARVLEAQAMAASMQGGRQSSLGTPSWFPLGSAFGHPSPSFGSSLGPLFAPPTPMAGHGGARPHAAGTPSRSIALSFAGSFAPSLAAQQAQAHNVRDTLAAGPSGALGQAHAPKGLHGHVGGTLSAPAHATTKAEEHGSDSP